MRLLLKADFNFSALSPTKSSKTRDLNKLVLCNWHISTSRLLFCGKTERGVNQRAEFWEIGLCTLHVPHSLPVPEVQSAWPRGGRRRGQRSRWNAQKKKKTMTRWETEETLLLHTPSSRSRPQYFTQNLRPFSGRFHKNLHRENRFCGIGLLSKISLFTCEVVT